ncbi:hypothetical protein DL546_003484 [Coniochaeta pulveracea]|uniref:Uncharacterized protein n=1 Tax=Coniochaeta pulveracea TaxID=177199 RepID=A0A420Y6Q9_9PEZI|nr:hypothetical protein DL546_003484 [Coniochaeta pulveracea]
MAVPTSYADMPTFQRPSSRPRRMEREAPLPAPLVHVPRPSSPAEKHDESGDGHAFHGTFKDAVMESVKPAPGRRRRILRAFFRLIRHDRSTHMNPFLHTPTIPLRIGGFQYEIANRNSHDHGKPFTTLELRALIRRLMHVDRRRVEAESRSKQEAASSEVQSIEFEINDHAEPDNQEILPLGSHNSWYAGSLGGTTLVPSTHEPAHRHSRSRFEFINEEAARRQVGRYFNHYRTSYYVCLDDLRYSILNPSHKEPIQEARFLDILDVVSGHAKGYDLGSRVRGCAPEDMKWWEMTEYQNRIYNSEKLHELENRNGWFCVALDENTYGHGVGRVYFVSRYDNLDPLTAPLTKIH